MSGSLPIVGILGGTGKEGSGLALRWARNGYPLIIGSRSVERAVQTAQELRDKVPGVNVRGSDNVEAASRQALAVDIIAASNNSIQLLTGNGTGSFARVRK